MEDKLTHTPETGSWRLRHQIDRIYGHLPEEIYTEAENAADEDELIMRLLRFHRRLLRSHGEEMNIDLVELMEKIKSNPEALSYLLSQLRAYAEALKHSAIAIES